MGKKQNETTPGLTVPLHSLSGVFVGVVTPGRSMEATTQHYFNADEGVGPSE